mmetsp:Transcript_9847/g.16227  ORF Transcript_9847/g.16227 Transcript_9847/m.16227 type:complete len:287 (-) Transcript_9847:222-1082(-)|eukprot:CAMPEP_0175025200 /NCGR_PEP_ID=MMETSP0005-20121125/16958_1 /TAXON_ID=420556 /ORGANISM="Ochromonas sp., Strain CCMP1393" /LENGTH=286 /DNA_ID=CAMNT_0016283973 /DNA_START=38 /DNA_END=898 /DNA_ORIENTATION=+
MKESLVIILIALCILPISAWLGLSASGNDFIKKSLQKFSKGLCIAPIVLAQAWSPVQAAEKQTPVYFGVGCFWHVQHEFVETERKVLGRGDDELTSVAGYAGSTRLGKDTNRPGSPGVVCYHNIMGVGDYGKLGYGEAVQVQLPVSSSGADESSQKVYRAFADEYFSLFGADRERPDKGDLGPEYRSLVGLPGGMASPYFAQLQAAADQKGMTLLEGQGETDKDLLGKKSVWVMDSEKYPFKQAEIYHQFHDGFMPGEQYPQSYNQLVKSARARGAVLSTGCPDVN